MLIRLKNIGAAVAIAAAAAVSVSLAAGGAVGAGATARSGAAKAPAVDTGTREIVVEGTGVRVSLWTGLDDEGRLAEHYAVSLDDGKNFSPPRATDYTVKLRYDEFDPMGFQITRAVDPAFASGDDTNLHIVQFVTQPLEAYRAAIRDLDGTIRAYLAHHAHVVEMTPATREAVAALPFVRWIGPYHPAYRLEEFMIDNAVDADTLYPVGTYNVRVFAPDQKAQLAGRVTQLGGVVDLADAGRQTVRVTLTADQLFELARADEVMFIDRWGPLEADMDIARQIGGAATLDVLAGYDGTGVRGEVIDLGFNLGHVDFVSRPLIQHGSVSSDSHGAATSGIIFGDGTGNTAGKGLCYEGQGIVISTSVMEGTSRYDNFGELVQSPYFAVFQSSSVGSPRTLVYNNESADMDDGLFDFDFVLCQSQSNAGDQMSRPQAWAKNVIAVGGVRHFDTLTKNDDAWNGSASIGPAADGRIKPDLCHFYDNIFTTTTGSSTSYTSSFGGTSGATPIVAGHVGLFMQMWADGIFGNPVDPFGTVFENRPHATTCKAMMINTASQYGFNGLGHDLTRVHQGWGMPDLQWMYDHRFKMVIVDETDVLTNLDDTTHYVDVEAGEPALRATLVYADPGGTTSSSLHRINNLSLRVTSPGGTVYWGNNGLLEGNWSVSGGSENTIDTVENVFVQAPEAGQWTVEVLASEIVEDAHVETPQVDADYALVISGVEESLPPLFVSLPVGLPAIVDAGTPVDLDITINDGAEAVVPGSETLHYRFDAGSAFASVPLTDLGGGSYLGTVPGASCG
ncbi:MAG: S8 family serine peptidase, partial [Planctomycetes bacterium]|nr:S8 family serine peptidase [Planctomycetota bacterium]